MWHPTPSMGLWNDYGLLHFCKTLWVLEAKHIFAINVLSMIAFCIYEISDGGAGAWALGSLHPRAWRCETYQESGTCFTYVFHDRAREVTIPWGKIWDALVLYPNELIAWMGIKTGIWVRIRSDEFAGVAFDKGNPCNSSDLIRTQNLLHSFFFATEWMQWSGYEHCLKRRSGPDPRCYDVMIRFSIDTCIVMYWSYSSTVCIGIASVPELLEQPLSHAVGRGRPY